MKIAIHVLAILSALSVVTSEIASDATDDDDYSFWVELKMVRDVNRNDVNYDLPAPQKFGAVLVSDSWILTRIMSFRCPRNDYDGTETCAQSTLSNWEAIIGGQKRNITKKVLHPKHHNNANNDFTYGVVLAKLKSAVVIGTNVKKVSLSPPGVTSLDVGKKLTIFWKQYKGKGKAETGQMKKANVYVTPCHELVNEAFCASASPSRASSLMEQYDTLGGSPAVLYDKDQAYLVGIIMGSGGPRGSEVDSYIHFLGNKAKWIEKVVKSNDV